MPALWLTLLLGVLLWRPRPLVAWLARTTPQVLYFQRHPERVGQAQPVEGQPASGQCLAITIDDSPDPIGTPRLLQVLAHHQVPATFFVITNQLPGNETLVQQMVAAGHELGNHGTRNLPSLSLQPAAFEQDLLAAHRALLPYNANPRWFRPGWGAYTPTLLQTLARHGYQCALGSVFPYDPVIPSVAFSTAFILLNTTAGAIIILHDGPPGPRAAQTLARIIPPLQVRGFRFVTLSELAAQ